MAIINSVECLKYTLVISHSLISQDVFKAQKAMHKKQVRCVSNAKDPTKRADR